MKKQANTIKYFMKQLLVPIDFSSDSINALEHAIIYANKLEANIRMLHVEYGKKDKSQNYFRDLVDFEGKSTEELLKLMIYRYQKQINRALDYKIVKGSIHKEVCKEALNEEVHLIMMGTQGNGKKDSSWMGSNAFKIVSNAPCPVITIRSGFLRGSISKIILPIDASRHTRRKINFTADLAELYNAEVHIIGVSETKISDILKRLEQWVDQAVDYFQQRKIKYYRRMFHGDNITNLAIDYAKSIDADLISIMTEQGESPVSILLSHLAESMVNKSPIPVLTIRPKITYK